MARWNAPFEVKQIKQLALIARLSTHHGKPSPPNEADIRLQRKSNRCVCSILDIMRICREHDILQQLAELTQFAPMTETKAFQTETTS
jgi:hypothetical protein